MSLINKAKKGSKLVIVPPPDEIKKGYFIEPTALQVWCNENLPPNLIEKLNTFLATKCPVVDVKFTKP